MEEANQQTEQAKSEHVKCPSCGAEMAFNPETGKLTCAYCGQTKELEAGSDIIATHDFTYDISISGSDETSVTAHCNNCGATITVDQNTTAQVCAFCGSPMVIQNESGQSIVPDAVLPFKISNDDAAASFKNWIKGKFFSPKALRKLARMQRLNGIYIPHFVFDCKTTSEYTAEAGTHYYETELVTVERDGKTVQEEQEVQKTRWEPVNGIYNETYYDRAVNASKNVDRNLINLKFGLQDLKPYSKDYIYGFQAEKNSITKDDCWAEARDGIENSLKLNITESIQADEVRNLSFSTDYSDIKYKYVLLPVWISVYSFKNKLYKFMINGQTGEVKGQAPLSALRIITSILLTVGVPAIIFAFNNTIGIIAFIIAVITLAILANRKPK